MLADCVLVFDHEYDVYLYFIDVPTSQNFMSKLILSFWNQAYNYYFVVEF